jgi:transcriptional regulator with XRE-family HTH domain
MTTKYNQELGKKIQLVRRKNTTFTQEQMGEFLEIDPRCYRKYESGETSISAERLEQIAKIFKMDTEEIKKFTEDRFVQNNTFHNQKGNGVNVQPYMSDGEKGIFERWLAEKDETIRKKDEIIDSLRQENSQQRDEILFLKEQIKVKSIKI